MAVISLWDRRLRRIEGPARAAADDARSTRPWIGPTYFGPVYTREGTVDSGMLKRHKNSCFSPSHYRANTAAAISYRAIQQA